LAEEKIGEGTLFATLLKLEAQGFLSTPLRQRGNGTFQFCWSDGIEVILYKQSIAHFNPKL
jgi:hypothetical protein